MKLLIFLLFVVLACNNSEQTSFSTIQIRDGVFNEYVRQFISINEHKKTRNEIVITSQVRYDTTIFYLTAGVGPDFEKAQVLGCAYIEKMLIWLQGEKPDERFIAIMKLNNEKNVIVDTVNKKGEIIQKHPIQWTIKFKGDKFLKCQSNLGEDCKL